MIWQFVCAARERFNFALTQYLVGTDSIDDAVTGILQLVCEELGWEWGAFWALDESGGPLLHDAAGYADLSRSGSLTAAAGPSVGSHGTAFVASSGGAASAANLIAPAAAFSLEAWVSTTSTAGGVIVGDGMYPSGSSHLLDRVLYLSSSGRACLGELTAALVRQTACSPAAVNNGLWHHLVVTADASGARVYVDGALVTTKTGVVARPTFGGFWRVGGDDLTGYSPASTSTGLTATLADVAAYPVALSAATVQAHFAAGG